MPHPITKGLGSDGTNNATMLVPQGYGSPEAPAVVCDPFNITLTTALPTYVDFTFNLPVGTLELQAADPSFWVFTTTGDVPITATGLEVLGSVVRVSITEPRGGDSYVLLVPENGLKSTTDDIYNGDGNIPFTGVAQSPVASQAQVLDARTVRVIYSEAVIAADALTISNYSIAPTLAVRAVTQETASSYILTTDPQTPGTSYLLTIYNVRDLSQNPV